VKARPFDSTDMDKDIFTAVLRLNEAKALLAVEPLYGTCLHLLFL
jgi:hypothetical protein